MKLGVPVTSHWFDFEIRRNRISYLVAVFLLYAVMLVVFFILSQVRLPKVLGIIILLAFFVPGFIASLSLMAQRLRDLNISGWFCLMWFALLLADKTLNGGATLAGSILLACIPGTSGPNKFGADPTRPEL